MRTFFDSRSRLALLLITIMILGGTIIPAAMLGRNNSHPSIPPPVKTTQAGLVGNDQLGIDCGLGTTSAILNATNFPVAPTEVPVGSGTPASLGPEVLSRCTWTGDVSTTADTTTEPMVSDQDELLTTGGAGCIATPTTNCAKVGGGFTANIVLLQNATSATNGFDITLGWNPKILHGVEYDFGGLGPFGTGGPFIAASTIDNVAGSARLAEVITGSPLGGNFTLYRIRFDVIGIGATSLTISQDTITGGTVSDVHQTVQGSFDSQTFYNPALNWNAAFTNSTPINPGGSNTFTATVTGGVGVLSYAWQFDSTNTGVFTSEATTNPATLILPSTFDGNRVTLRVTDSATPTPNVIFVTQRLGLTAKVTGTFTATAGTANAGPYNGFWLGGLPNYSGSWRLCPGSALSTQVCTTPTLTIAAAATQTNIKPVFTYKLAGVYTDTLTVFDTETPSVYAGQQSAVATFLVTVTGSPALYTVTLFSNSTTPIVGKAVNFTAVAHYASGIPAALKSTTINVKFLFGDGTSTTSPITLATGGKNETQVFHTYISAGTTALQASAVGTDTTVSLVQETSNSIGETVGKTSPTISTTLQFTSIIAGSKLFDTAALSSSFSAGGTVTYSFFTGSTCAGTGTVVGTPVTVANSIVPRSGNQTFPTGGSFSWNAVYSGDSNNNGATSGCEPMTVTGGTPSVAISCPTTGTVGIAVTCTATGTGGTPPYTFAWAATGGTPASGTGATFMTTYSTAGSKTVSVTLTDSASATATASTTVTVSAAPLTVTVSCPTAGTVGTAVACTATSSGGTGAVTFAWTATGGNPASGTGASFSTTYSAKGTETISVIATDAATPPVMATNSATVTINPLALTVSIAAPTNGPVGTAVTFTATGSGGTTPYTFAWTATSGTPASGTGSSLTTTYAAAGTYTVSVIITDANAKTATASATIVITAAALTVSIACPTTGTVGTAVSCTASSSGGTGTVSFAWTTTGGSPASGTGSTFMTTYNVKGSQTISVTATDSATPPVTATNSATVTINPLALSVSISGPTTGSVGTSVTFTATGSGGTAPYSLVWTVTGGSPSSATGSKIMTTYGVKGSYTVSVTITDSNAKTATSSTTIAISPLALSVIVGGPTTGTVGTSATFTATGSGGTTPYTFSWTTTGGSPSTGTGSSITTTYSSKGSRTILVTITDGNGATATGSATIVVSPIALAVSISGPTTGGVNTAVTFTATGTGGTTPYTFAWTATGGSPATGTGSGLTTMYASPGTFTVSVTITDGNANTATASATIMIGPGALSVSITGPTTGTVGTAASFTATGTGGTAPYTFAWTASGGTPSSGTGASFTTTYNAKGSFTVSVTITDSASVTASSSTTIAISPLALTVTISSPTTGTVGTAVTFSAAGSGGTSPYTFSWTATGGSPASGTGATLTTTYNVKGTFTASVTITDSNAKTATASTTIMISPLALAVSIGGPTTGTVGTAVTFTATGTGGTAPYTFAWTATGGTPSSGTTASFSTSFNAAGTFTVSVTITDSNGKTASSSTTISITATSLTVTINCPTTGTVGATVACTASATGGTGTISFSWTATGGTPSSGTGAGFATIYSVKGSFTISVTTSDSASPPITGTNSATVAISPLALAVSILGQTTGLVNSPAIFTASPSGGTGPFTFSWTATGGAPATGSGSSFTTAYSAKGTYAVSVTVTDANAQTASSTATILISPLAVTVSISGSTAGTAGIAVTFTATGSGGTTPYSFAWTATGGSPATGTTSSLSTTYATAGTYTVSVTLTDGNGQTATMTATIVISPAAALVVTINCPTTGTVGTIVNCTASSTGGTGTVAFSWTATGGTPSSGTGPSFSTTYAVKGSYTISVTGTDSALATDSKSTTVMTFPLALSADFTFTPSAPTNATAVTFTATVTGGTSPYTYNWSFGDSTGSAINPATHTFIPGTFTVTLNVTDSNGISKIVTHTVTVTSSVSGQPILLTFQAFNFTAFHDGFGSFQVLVNGHLVTSVGIPFVRSATIANASFAPGADKFVTFGPFDITALVVQGPNNITFVNPTTSRFSLIKNVMIVQGNTVFLNFKGARFISPGRPVTLTFSNPPLSITGFSASNNNPTIDQDVTFTATFTGGTGPFKCLFRFGDDDFWGVSSLNGSCSVTTDFDDTGTAAVSVRITGATTGDDQRASLTLNIMPDASSSTTQLSPAAQCQTVTTESFKTPNEFQQETD